MGQKQSAQAKEIPGSQALPVLAEPFYSTKRYTTDELIHLLDQAAKVTFRHPDEFRMEGSTFSEIDIYLKTALLNLQKEGEVYYDVSFEDKEDFENIRLSKSIAPDRIPYAMSKLVKQAFMRWDFLDQPNRYLEGVHNVFVVRVKGAFLDLLDETQESHKVYEILDEQAEFLKPNLVYAAQMLFISFINDLTKSKYPAEAKALHQFIRICKKIMSVLEDPNDRKKTAVLVVPVLLEGLHLNQIYSECTSENAKLFKLFLASIFNLALRHPLFDDDYDEEMYELYARLDDKCQALEIGIEVNPALAHRDLSNFFTEEIKRQYSDIVTNCRQMENIEAKRAVYNFFINKIKKVAAFEPLHARAVNMHNILYLLKLVYQEDKQKNEQNYAKLIRQLLQVPSVDDESDVWFDKMAVSCLLQRGASFKHEFSIDDYKISAQEQQEYCILLTHEYEVKFQENSELKDSLRQKDLELESQQEELAQLKDELEDIQKRLDELSIQNNQQIESSVGSTTPSSSPSSTRHHFPHFHASKFADDSPPKARKLSNPPKLSVEKSPPRERKKSIDEDASLPMQPSVPSASPPRERRLLHSLSASVLRPGKK